jgi:hypothetical protein
MKRIVLTEDEKQDILSKYTEADNKIMIHLRRNYPALDVQEDLQDFFGKYRIMVDDKTYAVKNNFNRIVNLIDLDMKDTFPDVDDKKRRQTIKKYVKYFDE